MNLLTNICNPKQQHFQQQARTQTYKPLTDYVFQNRSMQRMRARYQGQNNQEQFKYLSWNHPYSISNFFMQKNGAINGQGKQSVASGGGQEYMAYQAELAMKQEDNNGNKKISFKEIPQAICGIGKEEEEGEKLFSKREDFYASLRSNNNSYNNFNTNTQGLSRSTQPYQTRNFNTYQDFNPQPHQQNDHPTTNQLSSRFSRTQHLPTQPHHQQSYLLLSRQILQLKQENKELRRVVDEEYKPMKEIYKKLLAEQEEREYLISKLEWKVKEMVKEMGVGRGGEGGVGEIYQKKDTAPITPMAKVDAEKHFNGQTVHSTQPFSTFQNKFSSFTSPETKLSPQSLTPNRFQSQNGLLNHNAGDLLKSAGQTSTQPSNGFVPNYQKIPSVNVQNPQYPYTNGHSITGQTNTFTIPQPAALQQNNYLPNSARPNQLPPQSFPMTPTFNQNPGFHQPSATSAGFNSYYPK